MLETPGAIEPRPRRPPAHLSVSLRHESPSPVSSICSLKAQAARDDDTRRSGRARRLSLIRGASEESNETGDSHNVPAEVWFDESNKNVGVRLVPPFLDNEPPFFLQNQAIPYPQYRAGTDNEELSALRRTSDYNGPQLALGLAHRGNNGSSIDDFRSVIDDLTIQNKKLKERLRRYERNYGARLEKDRLFEVKFHGLNQRKKRELEETLRTFASSISKDDSTTTASSHVRPKENRHVETSLRHSSKNPSSTSTNSQMVDSGYASMSTSGPTSSSTANHTGSDRQGGAVPAASKMGKIQSFLDDIPQGLLPKHPTVMTERGKKKLVVRRLEQLFTGRLKASHSLNHQPQQQQEVSNSAARDDRQAIERRGQHVLAEGIREAHILDTEMETERAKIPKLPGDSSADSSTAGQVESSEGNVDAPSSLDQRPTRPLDLDPDRAQVPAENIEYIRHLGISTPVMTRDDPMDSIIDDNHGWVYLNLLINMAQLHIMNVTPDFIRSAVTELSTKFQLSPDGRKIRWKGGTEGTELSSDSGADNGLRPSPNDSDSFDEENHKKRRLDLAAQPGITVEPSMNHGRFFPAPFANLDRVPPKAVTERRHDLDYKPLFARHSSSEDDAMSLDLDGSTSRGSYVPAEDSETGLTSNGPRPRGRSQSGLQAKRKRDDGAVIFYSGANFCTDLSGDQDNITIPLHPSAIDVDGFSNHSHDALGCKPKNDPRSQLSRTSSGSLLPFRPFKDYSICASPSLGEELRSHTPEPVNSEEEIDLQFSPTWTSSLELQVAGPTKLEACGLGGTRPADHFAYAVKTRHEKLDRRVQLRFSKFSPSRAKSQRLLHMISKLSLNTSQISDQHDTKASRVDNAADDLSATASYPLHTEILSIQYQNLEPSILPPPATYHGPFSSSTEWSDDSSADDDEDEADITGILPRAQYPSYNIISASPLDLMDVDNSRLSTNLLAVDVDEDEDEDESDTSSIDILAHARKVDPDGVAAQDREYEREMMLLPAEEGSPASADSVAGNSCSLISS